MDALQNKRFYLQVWNSLPWKTTFAKAYGTKLKCYWKLFGEHVRNLELFALTLPPPYLASLDGRFPNHIS